MKKKVVLIDGHSILNRAFYGIPDLTNSEGLHTNAVYGFLNILFKILEEENAEFLIVAFDVKHPTFRHEMFPEYKGTRKSMPSELSEQVPLMKEVLKAMGIKVIEKPGYEADDILGTIAKQGEKEGYEISLVSGDRDLLQLATDNIKIRIPKTKQGKTEIEDYYTKDVFDKYLVLPDQITDLKGLMGDASDNIPGVPGIGEKTAAKILTAFSTIENAYEHIEEIMPNKARESLRENYELAKLSKVLATIKVDCELEYCFETSRIDNLYNEDAFLMFKRLEFKKLLTRFEPEAKSSNDVEEKFRTISSVRAADAILLDILKLNSEAFCIGISIIHENSKVFGLAIAYNEHNIYYIKQSKANDITEKNLQTEMNFQVETNLQTEMNLQTETNFQTKMNDLTKLNEIAETYPVKETSSVLGAISVVETNDITEVYLLEFIDSILKEGISISIIDLKEQLKFMKANEESKIFDTSIAAYLLNPSKDTYLFDDIARDYLNMTVPSKIDLLGKSSIAAASMEKEEEFNKYVCYSAYVALKAYKVLQNDLKTSNMLDLYYKIEMPLIYTLYDMQVRGIKVNKEELKAFSKQLEVQIQVLEKNIYELVGETFNINSPKQLGVILFDKLSLPFAKKTKTGYSTSADILEKLKCEHPAVSMILEYRQLSKLKSTYADGLANYIDDKDQRIHGKFNQMVAATGRISSTEPNLQNIPIKLELGRAIRKVFIPEDGYVFLDADYSQIELRVLAHMSTDERLINAYKEDEDIHKITASEVFHTPLNEVTSAQRSNAKAVNFGIVYGISSFGLGQDLNITRKEAESYITKYFETYPRVKNFLDELVINAKEEGFVTTLFDRRRPVPELSSSNFMTRSFGERIAMNSPIQGTAADIIKIAMINVNIKLKKLNLKSRLLLQIHDELLIETHVDEIEEVKKILSDEMHQAADLSVPLEVEVNTGLNWYEVK